MAVADVKNLSNIERCKNYLLERGFPDDPRMVQKSGIEFAGSERCYEALGRSPVPLDDRVGIIFHYPEIDYCTVRWLGTYTNGWGQIKGKDKKLECPKGGNPPAYMPSLVDWDNVDRPLYICESALKALILSSRGYMAIGGNGVFGLYNKNGWAENFPHDLVDLCGRVEILFDNDYQRNPHVRLAVRRLGSALQALHPNSTIVHKPLIDPPVGTSYWDIARGKKAGTWGIDDAIYENGDKWLEKFLLDTKINEIEATEIQRHFDELNELYTVCHNPIGVIEMSSGNVLTRNEFISVREATRTVFNDKGNPVSVAEMWVKTAERTEVRRIVYSPGLVQLQEGDFYNRWKDSGVDPIAPPKETSLVDWVAPFLKVYKNAIPDYKTRDLLIESIAYMVQNRGKKINKTFLLVGNKQGTGKSLLASTVGKMLGHTNYSSIGADNFTSTFNGSWCCNEMVLLDEMYAMGRSSMAKLKNYITEPTVMVNTKGVKEYEIDNHMVFFITANEYGVLPFDDNDRRILAVHFDPEKHHQTGSKWWTDYINWLESGGYGKLRWWFSQIDLSDFNPNFMPPMTEAKKHMMKATQTSDEEWVDDVLDDPDSMLFGNKRSAYTATELYMLMTGSGEPPTKREAINFGQALGRKFTRAAEGKAIKVDGKVARYWIVRGKGSDWNAEKTREDVKAHKTLKLS
tara:strand:+ start:4637 stop:6694 length:2058 start_codon:yes stop_codon:yes gene_type:complete